MKRAVPHLHLTPRVGEHISTFQSEKDLEEGEAKVLPSGISHIFLFFNLLPAASYLEDANWKAVTANNAVGKLIISNFISRQTDMKNCKIFGPKTGAKV